MKTEGITPLQTPAVAIAQSQAKREAGFEQALQRALAANDDAKLRNACREMEAVFLHMMLQRMRATVPKTGLLGDNGKEEEIFQDMLDQELTKEMAKRGTTGLAEMLYKQLSQQAAKTNNQAQRK